MIKNTATIVPMGLFLPYRLLMKSAMLVMCCDLQIRIIFNSTMAIKGINNVGPRYIGKNSMPFLEAIPMPPK